MRGGLQKTKSKCLAVSRRLVDNFALACLQRNAGLWRDLQDYIIRSESTGCSYSDYWELYKAIRMKKPREILECGTGVSTVVIAYALLENEVEGHKGRITSMEEVSEYYELATKLLPDQMRSCVDLVHSPRVEDYYSLFRGVRYRDVPSRPYDFVFVDGPSYVAPSDRMLTFDFDYIYVVRNSEHPVYGIVDKRVSTCYVLQKVLGKDKVKYSPIHNLGYVGPCTRRDLRQFDPQSPSSAFLKSFKLFGRTELKLKL